MELKDVKVHKNDNCFTYVCKRVGLETDIRLAKNISKEAFKPFNENEIKVGDIVSWKYRKHYHLWDTEIRTVDGKPAIFRNLEFAGLHFGVIETIDILDGEKIITISECVRNSNNYSHPTINLLTLTDRDKPSVTEERIPTYIVDKEKI